MFGRYAEHMPVCIPEDPDFAESRAEKAVWDALVEQLPDSAVLLHGQRLTDDRDDIELDLLVLWPGLGAAVLEVKGGRVGITDGRWHTDGGGRSSTLRRSPLEQAMVGKHTLYRYLQKRLSVVLTPLVDSAVLPYTILPDDWDVPDAPREKLLDGEDLPVWRTGSQVSSGGRTTRTATTRSSRWNPRCASCGAPTRHWRTCACGPGRSRTAGTR